MNTARTLVRSQYSCTVLCRNALSVQNWSVHNVHNARSVHNTSLYRSMPSVFGNSEIRNQDFLSVFTPAGHLLQPTNQSRGLCTGSTYRMPVSAYTAVQRGKGNTGSYKVFIEDDSGPISPFHDIPLVASTEPSTTFHVVIEIPRWTNAKMEIDTKSALNPIVQDEKKGKLRFVSNSFPHHGYIWNYGAFPQTWENPHHVDVNTGEKGDNDPVDICEIGQRVAKRGDVLEVKVLGILAMVDDGETDWKVLVIDVTDPLASKLNNLEDIEREMPGFLNATREWFRIYKMPDGKPENKFAFDGEFKDAHFAHKIIEETHVYWKQLVGLSSPSVDGGKLNTGCVTVAGATNTISRDQAKQIMDDTEEFEEGECADPSLDTWRYVHLK